VAVAGGRHGAVLPVELSDPPSKCLYCFPQPPCTQPCSSLRQDLCGAPVVRPRYSPVLSSPGLYVHVCSSSEQGRQGLIGDAGEQKDEGRGDHTRDTDLESWDYGWQQTSSMASLPVGPKCGMEQEPLAAQPNLNC